MPWSHFVLRRAWRINQSKLYRHRLFSPSSLYTLVMNEQIGLTKPTLVSQIVEVRRAG